MHFQYNARTDTCLICKRDRLVFNPRQSLCLYCGTVFTDDTLDPVYTPRFWTFTERQRYFLQNGADPKILNKLEIPVCPHNTAQVAATFSLGYVPNLAEFIKAERLSRYSNRRGYRNTQVPSILLPCYLLYGSICGYWVFTENRRYLYVYPERPVFNQGKTLHYLYFDPRTTKDQRLRRSFSGVPEVLQYIHKELLLGRSPMSCVLSLNANTEGPWESCPQPLHHLAWLAR
jgi:hypothetical protein